MVHSVSKYAVVFSEVYSKELNKFLRFRFSLDMTFNEVMLTIVTTLLIHTAKEIVKRPVGDWTRRKSFLARKIRKFKNS